MNRATSSDGWVRNHDNKMPGFTCSIITGCCNDCPFPCFARVLANGRLRERYLANYTIAKPPTPNPQSQHLDPFWPRFWPSRVEQVYARKKPSGIFLNIMGEWAGDWVPVTWQKNMFDMIRDCPQHRFYLLTKQPHRLHSFSPFPSNCYIGVSATTPEQLWLALEHFKEIEASITFLSLEPLLYDPFKGDWALSRSTIKSLADWLIIGCLTGTKAAIVEAHKRYPGLTPAPLSPQSPNGRWGLLPRVQWVGEVCEAADKVGIPIFLKENLRGLLPEEDPLFNSAPHKLRQEMPG